MVRPRMGRLKALEILIREGQRDNVTKAGKVRVRSACKALGLDVAETKAIELILEFAAPTETDCSHDRPERHKFVESGSRFCAECQYPYNNTQVHFPEVYSESEEVRGIDNGNRAA